MIPDEEAARAYCNSRCGPDKTAQLERLVDLLHDQNQRQNLVAGASLSQVWRRHIADSLQLLEHVPRETGGEWLDLGSGGGFPGLVVAIVEPQWNVTLVESRRLRAEWLVQAADLISLGNVQVQAVKLERVPSRPVVVISARAFAPLDRLLALSRRFSTPDTVWVLPKGRSARDELQAQTPWVRRMFHVEPSLTDADAGILVGRGVPVLR